MSSSRFAHLRNAPADRLAEMTGQGAAATRLAASQNTAQAVAAAGAKARGEQPGAFVVRAGIGGDGPAMVDEDKLDDDDAKKLAKEITKAARKAFEP